MNPALAGVALAVVVGAVVAVSARSARAAVLGLIIALLGASFLADPLPDSLGLAARLVGAVLGGYLLWVASRGVGVRTSGSSLGWPAEILVAGAAAAVGYGSHGLGAPAPGPVLAQAVGFALAALSVAPIVNGRDILRVGTGLILLAGGAVLFRTALDGTPDTLEQLVIAGLVALLGGAVAAIATAARTEGAPGFEPALGPGERMRRPTDVSPRQPG